MGRAAKAARSLGWPCCALPCCHRAPRQCGAPGRPGPCHWHLWCPSGHWRAMLVSSEPACIPSASGKPTYTPCMFSQAMARLTSALVCAWYLPLCPTAPDLSRLMAVCPEWVRALGRVLSPAAVCCHQRPCAVTSLCTFRAASVVAPNLLQLPGGYSCTCSLPVLFAHACAAPDVRVPARMCACLHRCTPLAR